METLEWRYVDRTGWGEGPWDNEPDKIQYPDPATGLPTLITRNPVMGNLCGYVGVPPGHKLHGMRYDDVRLDAHGGVNFSEPCMEDGEGGRPGVCHIPSPGEPDGVWWFGFDCSHAFDLQPGHEAYFKRVTPDIYSKLSRLQDGNGYRDLPYVKTECAVLAAQIENYDAAV